MRRESDLDGPAGTAGRGALAPRSALRGSTARRGSGGLPEHVVAPRTICGEYKPELPSAPIREPAAANVAIEGLPSCAEVFVDGLVSARKVISGW